MSNKVYDTLKVVAEVVLPSLGALYFALSEIWGLPLGGEITATITAIDAFLGGFLEYQRALYNKKVAE